MPAEVAERETTLKLEEVVKPSEEVEEVSEDEKLTGEEKSKTTDEEQAKTGKEKVKDEKPPSPEEVYERRVQSEVDKRTNSLREKREADTAYQRRLSDEIKELKRTARTKDGEKRLSRLLGSYDEEGEDPDKKEAFAEQLKSYNKLIDEYNEKSGEVEETAQIIGMMTEKLSPKIVKEFGLDDSNPNIRAINGVKLLEETVSVMKYHDDFLMAVEEFFPRGDELRKQLEEIIDGMAEFENEKSKRYFIQDKGKGLKVAPRKAPPAPSGGSGGEDLSKATPTDRIAIALEKMDKGK